MFYWKLHPFGTDEDNAMVDLEIPLPKVAQDFVRLFDSLSTNPGARSLLPQFEFEIYTPDEIIAEIKIDEVRNLDFPQAVCVLRENNMDEKLSASLELGAAETLAKDGNY